jgi:hypothetical protein
MTEKLETVLEKISPYQILSIPHQSKSFISLLLIVVSQTGVKNNNLYCSGRRRDFRYFVNLQYYIGILS